MGDGAGAHCAVDADDRCGVCAEVVVVLECLVVVDGSRLVDDWFLGVLVWEDGVVGCADQEVGVEVGGEVLVGGGGDDPERWVVFEECVDRGAEGSRGESVEGGGEFVDEDAGWAVGLGCEIDEACEGEPCVFTCGQCLSGE